ncbi:MAG: hypothetical protein ACYCT2_05700 [Thermoplasmataceae archaeon]
MGIRSKVTKVMVLALLFAFVGYSVTSVVFSPYTLPLKKLESTGPTEENVTFNYSGMSSTYNLKFIAPNGPIGASVSFAITVEIQKLEQSVKAPYSSSSISISKGDIAFPSGENVPYSGITANNGSLLVVFNGLSSSNYGNITLVLDLVIVPSWSVWIYHFSSNAQSVSLNIPMIFT